MASCASKVSELRLVRDAEWERVSLKAADGMHNHPVAADCDRVRAGAAIVTSSVEIGTAPVDQSAATVQLPLTEVFQLIAAMFFTSHFSGPQPRRRTPRLTVQKQIEKDTIIGRRSSLRLEIGPLPNATMGVGAPNSSSHNKKQ